MTTAAATPPTTTPYDDVPYPSFPIHYASLDQLAVTSHLFGLTPARPEKCRVLELGCADGGHLAPMAQQLPESEFVGLDLSAKQIEIGKQTLEAAGIRNLDLRAGSILDVDASWGKFDYIYCHGVYSWVPAEVRKKILSICRENLNPQGVAFVSYNTYPGWHMKQAVRQMMVFHASRFNTPAERVGQARALLDFLNKSVPEDKEGAAYAALLRTAVASIKEQPDFYLLHEYLEDINEPIYFYEFVNAATREGLQYLGETHVALMSPSAFAPEVERTLRHIAPDIIHMEQYMDFVRNRAFRQSMVCLPGVNATRNLTGEQIVGCYVSADLTPTGPVDVNSNAGNEFRSNEGVVVNSTDPLTKAALLRLKEIFPHFEHFPELAKNARAKLATQLPASSDQHLAENLLRLYATNLVALRLRDQTWSRTIPDRPRATPLARHQASNNRPVTSLGHDIAKVTALEHALVPLLDGTRDRAALKEAFREMLREGRLNLGGAPDPEKDPAGYDNALTLVVDQGLRNLVQRRMIVREG